MYLRGPNYLTLSRHGIYYLRIPIPIAFHPEVKASDIKLSLRTKNKQLALCLSTMLRLVVDNAFEESGVIAMDYKSIRQHVSTHFRNRLSVFRDAVLTDGPIGADRKAALEAVIEAAKGNREKFINHSHLDDQQRLVSDFCEQEGITDDLSGQETDVLLTAYQAAYLQHAEAALAFNAAQSVFDLQDGPHGRIASPSGAVGASSLPLSPSEALEPVGDSLSVLAERFLKEGERGDLWVAKTVAEKREALALLAELLEGKSVQLINKTDARAIKEKMARLPKNRNKSPRTKGLSLDAMLGMKDVPLAAVRTLNGYMSHFQSFFKWAMEQGYVEANIFEGLRFKVNKRVAVARKDAFSTEQLQTIYKHLTDNPDGLVKKDSHKWVSLIAMFTGARLNEVAQLGGTDLQLHDGVWCLSFTTDGDDANKRLKNEASRRLVPVHSVLLEQGLQDICEAAAKRHTRLFPDLSYEAQNGYGRNVGRWMNESLLVKLGMKIPTLTFHSLRHSFNTQLAQKDCPEHLQKAILGHSQSGMNYNTYFKEGFLPDQLMPQVNKFSLT